MLRDVVVAVCWRLKEARNISILSRTELTLYLGNRSLQLLHDMQTGIDS